MGVKLEAIGKLALAAAAILSIGSALAAQYPERPIRLILPLAVGGTTDVVCRLLTPNLAEMLGQQVVVDNRGGAGGIIGAQLTASATPDGYTLLVPTTSHTASPALMKLPYDPVNDFTMVALLADQPGLLVVHPSVKFNTFPEFIAYARKTSDLSYSSAGAATFPGLSMALLVGRAGLKMTHVPYKGGGPAMVALLSGEVQVKVDAYITAYNHVREGKLKLLAVTSPIRMDLLPDMPAVAEMGFPGYSSSYFMGVMGPKGLPESIRAKLEKTFIAAIRSERISKRLVTDGLRPLAGTGADLDRRVKREIAQWKKVVKEANIKLD